MDERHGAESMGVDARRLAALTASVRAWPELGVHAILIERSGRLIYEEYFEGFDERSGTARGRVAMAPDFLHDVRSVAKSVVSALVGLALADGAIKSLDQPVVDWFPEYPELNTAERRRLTLRQVLGMTSGLQWDESVAYSDPRNDEIGMVRDALPVRYVLSRTFTSAPGAAFNYNGGLVDPLGRLLLRGIAHGGFPLEHSIFLANSLLWAVALAALWGRVRPRRVANVALRLTGVAEK